MRRAVAGRMPVYAVLILLLVLNLGGFLLQDPPVRTPGLPVPRQVAGWQGQEVMLSHHEREILAPAHLVSRAYYPVTAAPGADPQVVWVNVIEAGAVSHLHNFMDSLVASGLRPVILKTLVIPTRQGPLRTSLVRYYDEKDQPFYLLLWYQWPGGTAENRWQWYWGVLKARLNRQAPTWQLVEVSTPVAQPDIPLGQSESLARLQRFAQSLYEASMSLKPEPQNSAMGL